MLGKFFNRFFKHSNGSVWWSKAKISFIASFILNLVITIYGLIQKTLAVNVILTLLIGTAIIYIQTLTASCLKTSKCSILAWLQLLGVICYILFAGYVVANRFVINLDIAGSSVSLKDQYKVEALVHHN